MNRAILAAVLTLASAVPAAASAQGRSGDWSLSGNMSLVSDYRFRGVSQTYKLPAVQGGLDLGHSAGFYVGAWGSNVSGNQYFNGAGLELDLYAGYKIEITRVLGVDLGFIYYAFPGATNQFQTPVSGKRYDTTEIHAGVSIGRLNLKLNYSLSDYFAIRRTRVAANGTDIFPQETISSSGTWYADLSYTYPLTRALSISAHVGRLNVKDFSEASYTDYKVGLVLDAASLTWGLAYVGNSADDKLRGVYDVRAVSDGNLKSVSKDTVVFSIGKTF